MEINKQDIEKEREIIKELQQQIAEKDKEIERLTSPCEYFINYNNHIVRKLPLGEEEVLLTPKEICDLLNGYAHEFMDSQERYDEWKRHKLSQYNSKKNYVRQVVEKEIRKQVCDAIREKLKKQIIPTAGSWLSYYDITETNDLLDQIEKGE